MSTFEPKVLDRTVIALPLLDTINAKGADPKQVEAIIIDLNLDYPGGRDAARERVRRLVRHIITDKRAEGIDERKSKFSQQYLFGWLQQRHIQELVRLDTAGATLPNETPGQSTPRSIYRIWPDFPVEAFINRSISTVKADAAHNAFAASGEGIVWAVMDSGIDATHPHFRRFQNLELERPLAHRDFTTPSGLDDDAAATAASEREALVDVLGHGTHVAGIIAGYLEASAPMPISAEVRRRDESGDVQSQTVSDITRISGMAPRCKLLSLKVLDDKGRGVASNLIAAIEQVQEINGNGRRIRIHGVNMSVGYDFEPKWFACGQSPLCVEVDRLVKSGVVVVVAAGNTGYGWAQTQARGNVAAGLDLTINDPGNAEFAITVGSTHRDMPHIYGVSYFSSKGPTGDGRMKPDLLAPGEKIISCKSAGRPTGGAGDAAAAATPPPATPVEGPARYKEDSGTSMAAPHVSGVIAAFLSIRGEFIGRPEVVKNVFLSTATDLKRAPYFQGRGLVDLMRAIQSI